MSKYYITTAIDYVNSLPHLGTAYEKIGADALARFMRRLGHDVHFQMGNDEHSTNVYKAAQEQSLEPKAYCDQMRMKFEDIWQQLNISYDGFIQTSQPEHHTAAQALFQKIYESGDIYKGHYEGWYCESCEAFYTEKDLVDEHCPNHKSKPKWLKEENYFFKLSRFQEPLLKLYEEHPEFILPEVRRNEVKRLVEDGLQDISVSRAGVPWGIPLPIDENEVIYVWFDALINYLTAIGYPDSKYEQTWPADIHVIGKDITRFHCVIWPAMLMSAGLPLPKTVFGHGFVYLRGEKMSKSLGNIVTPLDIIPQYGADALRYYLLAESSFGADGDFTWDGFINRFNASLANDLGNALNRTIGMAFKYQAGVIKKPAQLSIEQNLADTCSAALTAMTEAMDPQRGDIRTHQALNALWELLSSIDKHIDQQAPWALHKAGNNEQVNEVLYNVTATLRYAAVLLAPFMPDTSVKIWERLGLSDTQNLSQLQFKQLQWNELPEEIRVQQGQPLFPRIDTKEVPAKPKKKGNPKMENTAEKTEDKKISIDDFAKVELRVAKVLTAEKVEGADRLLKLQIDLGNEQRQLVAGIAQSYAPDEIIGKQVVVVANLKPAKIRGVESNGMVLAASGEAGAVLLQPLTEVPLGSQVK